MITSKLTSKAQTTVPQFVRAALRLEPGDEIAYFIDGAHVVLARKPAAEPQEDPFAVFEEWATDADTKAYADL